MNDTPAISLKNVSFSYDNALILKDVDFSIARGEFVGIFGPNGGGKTTLLRLLMGFLTPSCGEILLNGKNPKQARPHIGYVPQISKIDKQFPIMTEEVVAMGCLSKDSFWGKLSKESKKKVSESLEKVGMAGKKNTPFGHLSGGQAQRVLIARALASEPQFLFLDEPTANVDPVAEQEILLMLSSITGNMTVLMVTHDLQTILEKVGKLLCVHRKVHALDPSQACEHYGLGLYHTPLIQTLAEKNHG